MRSWTEGPPTTPGFYWKLRGESRYKSAAERLSKHGDQVTIIREESYRAVLDVPDGTVKSRLYYAKRALRNVLEKEAGDHERT